MNKTENSFISLSRKSKDFPDTLETDIIKDFKYDIYAKSSELLIITKQSVKQYSEGEIISTIVIHDYPNFEITCKNFRIISILQNAAGSSTAITLKNSVKEN